jgi:hypothetical protein
MVSQRRVGSFSEKKNGSIKMQFFFHKIPVALPPEAWYNQTPSVAVVLGP